MTGSVLSVRELKIALKKDRQLLPLVRGASFELHPKKATCLVGESGCGKTLTALSILKLLSPDHFTWSGEIFFEQKDLLAIEDEKLREFRGRHIAMIFQEPMSALNPVLSIGDQINETILCHKKDANPRDVSELTAHWLGLVGLSPKAAKSYPHQLSGGMRQRAMIAMALCCQPTLLIADEPTTALDVSTQAQILDLLQHIQETQNFSTLMITHNLGIVAQIAQKVIIMYAGRIMEIAPAETIFNDPLHPYTKGLLASVPYGLKKGSRRLKSIAGTPPSMEKIPTGCPFHPRCPGAFEPCSKHLPEIKKINRERQIACYLYN